MTFQITITIQKSSKYTQEGVDGAKPEEISILYFKWAMRIKCAEEKMGNIFHERHEALKQVRDYMI